ncbi:MAG TPA: acyl carrier protein [Thermoleophilaceae bacterium]|jgi:acyl carrier protein
MPGKTVSPEVIEEKLTDALAAMGPERHEITRDARLTDLEIDSLDLVELLQVAEEEFGVEINPDDAKDVSTVGDALDLITARVA